MKSEMVTRGRWNVVLRKTIMLENRCYSFTYFKTALSFHSEISQSCDIDYLLILKNDTRAPRALDNRMRPSRQWFFFCDYASQRRAQKMQYIGDITSTSPLKWIVFFNVLAFYNILSSRWRYRVQNVSIAAEWQYRGRYRGRMTGLQLLFYIKIIAVISFTDILKNEYSRKFDSIRSQLVIKHIPTLLYTVTN